MTLTQKNIKHLISSDEKLRRWGYGEWVEEPDYVRFNYRGIDCEIMREMNLGHFCGYCIIPHYHPLKDKKTHDLQEISEKIHGGITFKDPLYIGFDGAHLDDVVPYFANFPSDLSPDLKKIMMEKYDIFFSTYKNINFISENCKILADQILSYHPTQIYNL